MKHIDTLLARLVRTMASSTFFWGVLCLLVVQAAWIALTSHYPMAFDEDFHLGIIRIYAHHLNPFLNGQPAGADMFGALARDPSYLYHYLFSFPYRLIAAVTHDQTIQVIVLRFMNIGLFASGLILFRRLLSKLGAPSGVIHGCLLFFVLIPVVPLLAAQINYDNLFIPAVTLNLLLAQRFASRFRQDQVDLTALLWLIIAVALTSLVKYAFLPILVAIVIYLLIVILKTRNQSNMSWRQLIASGWQQANYLRLSVLTILLLVSVGLWSQRYMVNLVHYHTPIPDCSKVLTIKQCSAYGPWIRDYNFAINKVDEEHNPFVFIEDWFYGMWLRLYFTVDGPATLYQTRGPLPVPGLSAIAIVVGGLILFITDFRKVMRRYDRTVALLFMTTSALYLATLFFDNYRAYVRTGQPVAINGRYLLPFIPLMLVLGTLAGRELLAKSPRLAGLLVATVFITQLWGGGVLTYILRSNDAWYWPSSAAHTSNRVVQQALQPVTPGYNEPAEFLR